METVEKCPKHCLIKKNGRCSMCEQERLEKVAMRYVNNSNFGVYDASKSEAITKSGKDNISTLADKLSTKFKVVRTKVEK